MTRLVLPLALAFCGTAASADLIDVIYVCERGVEIQAVYVTGGTEAVALQAEGRLLALPRAQAASGARFSAPEGSSYVWWNKGSEATLAWFDAEIGEEVTLYAFCREE